MNSVGFIPFIILNYPNKKKFIKIANLLKKKKRIKYIELGIPFSDSYSDGKVISKIYRKKKISINKALKTIKECGIKKKRIVLVCYYNTIQTVGIKQFFVKISKFVDNLIIVDQPLVYIKKIKKYLKKYKIKIVPIIPCFTKVKTIINLIKKIKSIILFIYITNRNGVTGKGEYINLKKIEKYVLKLKKQNIKFALGFGINLKNFMFFKKKIKNFVIGTELIKLIKKNKMEKLKFLINKCLK
ncbi:tryptophan synthase subunit alpha [Candidatus Vidania fulgoroideorum]